MQYDQAADNHLTQIVYRLPRTMVDVTAKTTTRRDLQSGHQLRSTDAQIALRSEADPEWKIALASAESFLAKRDLDLTFTDDGRLSKASAATVGAGPAIVEAAAHVIGTIAGVAIQVLAPIP